MATDTNTDADADVDRRGSERFEDIDWDAVERSGGGRSLLGTLMWASYLLLFLVMLYDGIVNGPFAVWVMEWVHGGPLAEYVLLGVDVGVGAPTFDLTLFGFEFYWDVKGVDWLFIATLLTMLWFGAVPLARNPRMTRYYWKEFRKNRAAVVSLAFLTVVFVVGTVGPLVMKSPQPQFGLGYQPPVFTTTGAGVVGDCTPAATEGLCRGTWAHPLGTTGAGIDILKLIVFGMRVSMQVALIATLLNMVLATAVGATAAYVGGWTDEVLMRYVDLQQVFPQFFLFLLVSYLFGGSLLILILIFGLLGWGGIARLVRAEALQRTEEEYFQAARNAGGSPFYVVRRHVIPNVSRTIVTAATLGIPILILSEAAFAFLGLTDPTIPSWGRTIVQGRNALSTAWWVSTLPGFFLFFTILAFNFLGDALGDAIDPRQE